ncbi:hypothetical protein PQR72_21995 [Paraburkholderia madseniana]|uniref:hypothetical protein n=1 Tax=Paraburkholderia madseniana TaxID=2599607 RepID=UPI0015C54A59|nr:hypothetical protein [Paraburkholderia madseniana]NPT66832.1 hypothetical protein [Paraburkholderia madseniana]
MTRPLALIEGDLTIPLPRPFDGLPPPFGTRRRVMREAVQQAVEQVAKPARAFLFPPGAKHILFYKAPPQRVDNGRWDAALAEAKRYLEMSTTTRPRSSRSDHLLAASIFAGCTIALTWLLVTCSMKEAEKAKAVVSAPIVLSATDQRVDSPKPVAKSIVVDTQTAVVAEKASPPDAAAVASVAVNPTAASASLVAQAASVLTVVPKQVAQVVPATPAVPQQAAKAAAASSAVPQQLAQAEPLSPVAPKRATQVVSRQTVQVIARDDEAGTPPAKLAKRVKVARLSEAHVNERMALSRATHPTTQPAMSKQPEWTAGAPRSHDDVSPDDAPWRNWSAQQHRPSPTIRAATPLDNSWNDHMTQRRITDDPAAFHTGGSRQ